MADSTLAKPADSLWRRRLALALQCLPLLAASSCLTRGVLGEDAQNAAYLGLRYLVVISAIAWGLGYLVLRRWGRWLVAFLVGGLSALLAANAALGSWSVAPDGQGENALRVAALVWGIAIVAAVAALLLDTWRLATRPRT
jgi:hypothetical protein